MRCFCSSSVRHSAGVGRVPRLDVERLVHRHHAARDVDLPRDGPQVDDRGRARKALHGHVERQAPLHRGWLLGHHLGSPLDLLRGHPGDLGGTLERPFARGLVVLLEAVAPVLHELVVVQVVLHDVLAHGQRQRSVGAATYLQPQIGTGGQPGELRVHDHQPASALHAVDHPVAQVAVGVRLDGVVARTEDVLRRHPSFVFVAVVMVLGTVRHGVGAHEHVGSTHARHVAAVAGQHVGVLHGSERVLQARHVGRRAASGAQVEHDRLGARLGLDRVELLLDRRVGFVPRDALPLVCLAAVLGVALQGVQHAVGMVHRLLERDAACAQAALVVGAFLVALHVVEPARLLVGVHHDAAAVMAAGSRPGARARGYQAVLLPLPRQVAAGVLDRRLAEEVGAHLVRASLLDFHVDTLYHTSLLSKASSDARAPIRRCAGHDAGPALYRAPSMRGCQTIRTPLTLAIFSGRRPCSASAFEARRPGRSVREKK